MRLSNLSIGNKLLVAFAAVLLAIGAMGGALYVKFRALEASDVARTAANKVNREIADLEFRLSRQENSFRGYLVSGDPYYLERLNAHRANFKEALASLREDGFAVEKVDAIDAAGDAWFEVVSAGARQARDPAGRAQAFALVGQGGRADQQMAAVEVPLEALKAANKVALDQARNAQRSATVAASWTLGVGLLVTLLIAVAAGFILTRAIASPLKILADVMNRLVANDLSATITGAERKDEIGTMSRAVQVFKDNAGGLIEASAQMTAAKRSQAVIEFDLQGNILDANDNFLKVMGYSLSEIRGRSHKIFVAPEFAASPEYDEMWRKLNAGQPIAQRFDRIGKDGRPVVIEAFYTPIPGADGRPVKIMKFATDVTAIEQERQRAAATQSLVVNETARGMSALASGDLSYRIHETFPGDYKTLQDDFNAAMSKLEEAMVVINTNAAAMQTGAGEISHAADDLSRRTEQQAATLEETAAALDQITATVRRTADGAKRGDAVVGSAKQEAEQSGQVVDRAVHAMGEIERSAEQISQIIGVIDEIAFQTNLLALNAGVEAARAGDAGKGFAVVASEVRALAQRSAEAAKEIKALISASTGQVKEGVGLVGKTGEALTAIVSRVSEINILMAEINASAQEQATALAQVNTAVNQMDQTTQQNAAMVEQSTAASHNLNQEAEQLAKLVSKFRLSGVPAAQPAPNPVRQAQARIARAASGLRRGGPARALAATHENEWEEF